MYACKRVGMHLNTYDAISWTGSKCEGMQSEVMYHGACIQVCACYVAYGTGIHEQARMLATNTCIHVSASTCVSIDACMHECLYVCYLHACMHSNLCDVIRRVQKCNLMNRKVLKVCVHVLIGHAQNLGSESMCARVWTNAFASKCMMTHTSRISAHMRDGA